ncbi:MAG TPA: S4 domain-containing protein, partial [Chitinophagales bacterium]|nr:S4 domain-containing protein [Chitinophagales bacterium]
GVPTYEIDSSALQDDISIIDLLATHTNIYSSKGEARRALKSNAVSINQEKVNEEYRVSKEDIITNGYILVRKGKKDYHLVQVV